MSGGNRRIRFFATPGEAVGESLHGSTVVVIDVLRATSTILAAIGNGAASVIPVESVETATRLVTASDRGEKLLAGEHKGLPIEGFDLFNSPVEFTGEKVGGRTVILATSNGTPAIASASLRSARVMICSIMNVDAVAAAMTGLEDIVILCSGNGGKMAGEDLLCAGILLRSLSPPADAGSLADSASIAMMLAERHESDIAGFLSSTSRGRELIEMGYAKDIPYCSRRGSVKMVPQLSQGAVRP